MLHVQLLGIDPAMCFDVSPIVAFNFARDVGLKNRPSVMHICICILFLGTYIREK